MLEIEVNIQYDNYKSINILSWAIKAQQCPKGECSKKKNAKINGRKYSKKIE